MEIDVSLRKCYYNNNLYDLKYLENEVRTMSSLDKQIDFTENSCKDFIDVLASSAPIPGGGGASALVGAIGVALGNMVGSLTVGKKRYADVEEDIIRCKKEADEIVKLLKGMLCHVNLIPINKVEERDFERPDKTYIYKFRDMLEKNNIPATVRISMGSDIGGACGQLRRKHK